ncbi:Retrovirus-related Pol polyprotein from transposon [Trichinella pseudospiralis]|uniref:Retrovirus-related Pol polyprotein from transposon n=1 Tax=Trichinella pseudospiralis TaxID=6337 RepID=A0A0V1E744_TRIPS|nr:Retrovirus-related Pol polyprotein from transposon [Trichinella pseudospiralis]
MTEESVTTIKRKCVLATDEVEFLGFRINARGIQHTQDKVKAILAAPRPTNQTELQTFLGLVNFYMFYAKKSQHCKTIATIVRQEAKMDLGHVMSDDTETPVAYASKTLTATKRNYAQIDKEALAIVFRVKKFHQYLYGKYFTIVTDHKPLLVLLKLHSPVPQKVSPRMLHWNLLLSAYNYANYINRRYLANADALSRLIVVAKEFRIEETTNVLLLEMPQMRRLIPNTLLRKL